MTRIVADDQTHAQITPDELQKSADTSKWFVENIKIPPQAQDLPEKYSGYAPKQILPEVSSLHSRAFKAWPYPCIGQLLFLDLTTSNHPAYAEVLRRLKENGHTYLDSGCCLGQDIRKLMFDGAPSSAAMYRIDVEPAFFDLGYELFRDRNILDARFITADLTQKSVRGLKSLQGSFDIISVQNVFHLFNLEVQKTVAQNLVSLTKPVAGSLVYGRQLGSKEGKEVEGFAKGTAAFAHSVETWVKFWQEIGKATASEWQVRIQEDEISEWMKPQTWSIPSMTFLVFTAVRQ